MNHVLPSVPPSARPLTSVGIDVGSATSQVVLSRLWLDKAPGQLVTTRVEVVHRDLLYASDVWLTPFTATGIDGVALRGLVEGAYLAAGVEPAEVETGAVIVTGEASRQANADAVAAAVAGMAGSFVCVAAGPRLEARLAALGAGAVDGSPKVRLHVDIGGATTKLAVIESGEIVATAATNVGARMLTHDGGTVTSISPALRRVVPDLAPGDPAPPDVRRRIAERLAASLLGFVGGTAGVVDEVPDEPVTAPLDHDGPFDALSFSGGVACYVYGDEPRQFGDLGAELGPAIASALAGLAPTVAVASTIRATVLGAGQFSTQVSGTTHLADTDALPVRGLRVAPLRVPPGELAADDVARWTADAYHAVDLPPGDPGTLLSIRWRGDPSYQRLNTVATGLLTAAPGIRVVAVDSDLAGALGAMLQRQQAMPGLVCVDEVSLGELDVVDIGAPVSDPPVLPLVVRSVLTGATVSSTH